MNTAIKDSGLVQKYAAKMHGVFSVGDLRNLIGEDNKVMLHRRIGVLTEGEILVRFSRGIYVASGYSPEVLSARIIESSYISLGSVLAKELMIGSVPARTVYAVRVGKSRVFQGPGLTVEYVGLTESLYFGYVASDAVRYATAEKALLDTLYFHLRGRRFSFDIYQDIDISAVSRILVEKWLRKYRNPRFVSFVKGYMDDRS